MRAFNKKHQPKHTTKVKYKEIEWLGDKIKQRYSIKRSYVDIFINSLGDMFSNKEKHFSINKYSMCNID